jgi:thioredoxin 1
MVESTDRGSTVREVTGVEFERLIREARVPVLVDFHASWCAPCRWLEPILDELVRESHGRFAVAKVDVDQAPEIAARLRIASVPTVILFRDGVEVGRSLGVEPERLREMLGPSDSRTGSGG